MIEDILNSKVKVRIAKLFSERREAIQVSDVARILKISKSRASECLSELTRKGILERKAVGRSILYTPSSSRLAKIIFAGLAQEKILLNEIEKSMISEIKKLKPVSFALFGSALKGLETSSDIDFILLYKGDFKNEMCYKIASDLTERFGIDISILTMNVEEFRTKVKKGEEFSLNILANHKLLYGKKLEDIVWSGKLEKRKL